MKTFLDWSEYADAGLGDAYADIPKRGGDFAKAVAVCINSRQCEGSGRGVMCPSFRVTGDPEQTPGGRVRLLKRALNGASGALCDDPELAAAMDLCVGCKGCKRECENSVDMAQLKIEYLAQRHARDGLPLRTRLFGHLPRWLGRLPGFRGIVRLRNRASWLRRLGRRILGLSERPLPEPAVHPFADPPSAVAADNGVVLFVDTFTRYYEPDLAEAAIDVLEAAGYRVIVARAPQDNANRPLCCGRTYLAHGMLDDARREAVRTLEALTPYIHSQCPILGLEPSCLLALRDDYRALGLGEAAEALSRRAWLIEEFIAREWAGGRMHLPLRDQSGDVPILVHGHCHQKAVGAMKSMRKILKHLPGADYRFVEASCCGMAGSFGYEAEHEPLSKAMAEDALLPALRDEPEAAVVANGFSCRQQIREGSDHRPRHLVQLLRDLLDTREADASGSHASRGGR